MANILRALTDLHLLRRSEGRLLSGMSVGAALPLLLEKGESLPLIASLASTKLSASGIGAGLIVGARIGVPAMSYGLLWHALAPCLRTKRWLGPHDPVGRSSACWWVQFWPSSWRGFSWKPIRCSRSMRFRVLSKRPPVGKAR